MNQREIQRFLLLTTAIDHWRKSMLVIVQTTTNLGPVVITTEAWLQCLKSLCAHWEGRAFLLSDPRLDYKGFRVGMKIEFRALASLS